MNQLCQVGIKGVMVNPKTGKVLVLLKQEDREMWDVPGGRMKDESIEEALDRELKEEILNLKDYKLKGVFYASKIENTDLVLIYHRIEVDLDDIKLSEEHKSYRWVSLEEIDSLEEEAYIDPGIKKALKLGLSSS